MGDITDKTDRRERKLGIPGMTVYSFKNIFHERFENIFDERFSKYFQLKIFKIFFSIKDLYFMLEYRIHAPGPRTMRQSISVSPLTLLLMIIFRLAAKV